MLIWRCFYYSTEHRILKPLFGRTSNNSKVKNKRKFRNVDCVTILASDACYAQINILFIYIANKIVLYKVQFVIQCIY